MTHLRLKAQEIQPAVINLIAGSLKIGQVVVLPTDTVYGLSCLANNSRAIKRIKQLKKNDPKKPLLVLVSSLAMLKRYVFLSARQAAFLKKYWTPGSRPTTVILKHRGKLPKELCGESDGLALRLPKSKFLTKILETVKRPIVSTSLNLSGQAEIRDLKLLLQTFPKKKYRPDLVVDTGKCRRTKSSRVIDLRTVGAPLIIRK
jgi:L-threonylcarbamoyladenylate synthase